jgi:hypothetical protein
MQAHVMTAYVMTCSGWTEVWNAPFPSCHNSRGSRIVLVMTRNDRRPLWSPRSKAARLGLVLAGIILGQALLYGPSLLGLKILLPVDILACPNAYIPVSAQIVPQDLFALDQVYQVEPERRFAAAEFRAGRLPMWVPYAYTGVPFVGPKFSPFSMLGCCTESAVILAWIQLSIAIVAGVGAYSFFRRAMELGFWPSAICAWCYPLTGFFVLWQGFRAPWSVCWFPWLLLAVHQTVHQRERGWGTIALAVTTGLALTNQIDLVAQGLLLSGLFALWCLFELRAAGDGAGAGRLANAPSRPRISPAIARLALGWALGLLLAAPYLLPLIEYGRTGARMTQRSQGREERPPIGLAALPQLVLPDIYGSTHTGSLHLNPGHPAESSASGYCGLVATLVAAPLAWRNRGQKRRNLFWAALALLGMSWQLNLPGLVQLLRLPGLNFMSHNRLVFGSGFALLALAAAGLQSLHLEPTAAGETRFGRPKQSEKSGGWAWWLPPVLLAFLSCWCLCRVISPPHALSGELEQKILKGQQVLWIHDLEGVHQVRLWFTQHNLASAFCCWVAIGCWFWLRSQSFKRLRPLPILGALLVLELLWFAWGRSLQCDPALYYPPIPVLQQVANAPPGRIIGYQCLPADLSWMSGLRDVRGYDAVDPARLLDLILPALEPSSTNHKYARLQWASPKGALGPDGQLKLSPILDLLSVRYVVFRGSPMAGLKPAFQGPDYFIVTNASALPRVFVPRKVEVISDSQEQLARLHAPGFVPSAVAYVETPVTLSSTSEGQAQIIEENPVRVEVTAQMATPGLVVLSDLWDSGWRAWLNGEPKPILRTDHALRGVLVPAGNSNLEFRYEPATFTWGARMAGMAAAVLAVFALRTLWKRRSPRRHPT